MGPRARRAPSAAMICRVLDAAMVRDLVRSSAAEEFSAFLTHFRIELQGRTWSLIQKPCLRVC